MIKVATACIAEALIIPVSGFTRALVSTIGKYCLRSKAAEACSWTLINHV